MRSRRTDTVIKTKTGSHKVEAGQKVLGSCHLAQRDPSVFSNSAYKDPEQFDHRRFQEKVRDNLAIILREVYGRVRRVGSE